jgi:hypothetical protein
MEQSRKYNQNMRKKEPEKKEPKPEQYFFDPSKETKKEREARLDTMVKRALEGITQRAVITPSDSKTPQ